MLCVVMGVGFMPGLNPVMAQDADAKPAGEAEAKAAEVEVTVEQEFQAAIQLYEAKNYEAALTALQAIDAVQLSKEQQVTLQEAVADSQRQLAAAQKKAVPKSACLSTEGDFRKRLTNYKLFFPTMKAGASLCCPLKLRCSLKG